MMGRDDVGRGLWSSSRLRARQGLKGSRLQLAAATKNPLKPEAWNFKNYTSHEILGGKAWSFTDFDKGLSLLLLNIPFIKHIQSLSANSRYSKWAPRCSPNLNPNQVALKASRSIQNDRGSFVVCTSMLPHTTSRSIDKCVVGQFNYGTTELVHC